MLRCALTPHEIAASQIAACLLPAEILADLLLSLLPCVITSYRWLLMLQSIFLPQMR